jgi:hypothetical protein
MARHKQPIEVAKLKGADKKNPQRYKKDIPKSNKPLGGVPDHLSIAAKTVWKELVDYAIPGTITQSDRIIFETAAVLIAQFRSNPKNMPTARITAMIGCVARLGLSPTDRNKLGVDKKPEENPFDEF